MWGDFTDLLQRIWAAWQFFANELNLSVYMNTNNEQRGKVNAIYLYFMLSARSTTIPEKKPYSVISILLHSIEGKLYLSLSVCLSVCLSIINLAYP